MLSVELVHLANMLDDAGQGSNVSALARNYSSIIHDAIWSTTVRLEYCITRGSI